MYWFYGKSPTIHICSWESPNYSNLYTIFGSLLILHFYKRWCSIFKQFQRLLWQKFQSIKQLFWKVFHFPTIHFWKCRKILSVTKVFQLYWGSLEMLLDTLNKSFECIETSETIKKEMQLSCPDGNTSLKNVFFWGILA